MESVVDCVKWSFGLFERINVAFMSYSSHVDMFYTHSQSLMHCHTSVIAKCIFTIALGESHCNVVALREVCCSCILSDLFSFCIFEVEGVNTLNNIKTTLEAGI